MIKIRKSNERGHANHGWLDSYHSFSFASYFDPENMHFRDLRVINEDRIEPAGGFPTHPHRDMEIVTYIVEGALEHRDDTGGGSILHPGEIQRMSAGRGIAHSEFNPSKEHPVHLLQIWIETEQAGIEPGYEQKSYLEFEKENGLTLIASRGAQGDSVHINQDVKIYSGKLTEGESTALSLESARHCWIQVIDGSITVNGVRAFAGDGVAISEETELEFTALATSQFLVFDLK